MSTTIYGIDVSRYQGNINWGMVKNAGTRFAFVRAGFCGPDGRIKGNEGLDVRFRKNMREANEAGLPVGAYLYSHANSAEAAQAAARELLELLEEFTLRFPVAVQFADTQYHAMRTEENTEIAQSFLMEVETAGYYPMLYTYKAFAEQHLDMKSLSAYDLWLTEYANKRSYKGDPKIWQFGVGACDGVPVNCNLNVCYNNYAVMIAAAGLNRPGRRLTDSQIDMNRVLTRSLARLVQ